LAAAAGIDPRVAPRLVSAYGDFAPAVIASAAQDPALACPMAESLDVLAAEAAWAATREMAVTLEDALARRTRLSLLDRWGGLRGPGPGIVARTLGWDGQRLAAEAAAYAARLASERGPVASPATAVPAPG
ncbi:MAG: glycerol-3-phosphate dehydrogenase C-terminal domain-containing protein, partial [Actinomycetota bacterium]